MSHPTDDKAAVLVAFASRHGSTEEIAEAIADALRQAGLVAETAEVDEVGDLARYRAVVLGSAIYMGRWIKDARAFIDRNRQTLSALPLWLFSSGPIGDPPEPKDSPFGIDELARELNARGHHVFAGKVDKSELGFGEKAVLKMVGAGEGDFRDWQEIASWARSVADDLSATAG